MAKLVDFFVRRTLEKLADFVEGEICKVLGVKEEIETLKRRLARISPHLEATEQRRHHDAAINVWVTELKDIMYDVEDIIDDCMLEGGQLLEPHRPSSSSSSPASSSKVVSFLFGLFSSRSECTNYCREIANRIEQVNSRLKEISEDSLITSQLARRSTPTKRKRECRESFQKTTSTEYKADIVGTQIEEAAEDLIDNHVLKTMEENKRCNVIGIVGMGGIGKTTLARKIMNDDRIEEKFPIRGWVYVSKKYSRTDLLRDMVKQAGGSRSGAEDIQELEDKVSRLNNNFFIVLDDVWSTNVWNDILRKPILNAATDRCMILVTSRDESLVRSMKASYIHRVEGMNNDDGWKLLRHIVFEDEDSEGYGLDDIGKELVKLCGGLPLAIKVTGGVLAPKDKTRREWQNVLKSDLWQMKHMHKELPKALYLSYEDMPSHLKECFLSCALYPQTLVYGHELVRFWMAEGLIAEKDNNMLIEEVAEEYYKQLFRRNLLQPHPSSCSSYAYSKHDLLRSCCSMHDLLRSLAANLIGGEGIMMADDDKSINTNCLTKIRRLSLSTGGNILRLPNEIMEQKCLRSLYLYCSSRIKTIEVGLLEGLRSLRILNIGYTLIDSLPDSLFELVHLRYLNLEGTSIREIPEAIGGLVNLQTLNMAWCASVQRLPNSITKLHNLRCLRLFGSQLSHLPKGIGRLTNLNYIDRFVIGHDKNVSEGCDLGELQSFLKMRQLKIERLERASSTGKAVLTDKAKFLRFLRLQWYPDEVPFKWKGPEYGISGADFTEEEVVRAEKICAELMPPSTIEVLHIDYFTGRRFPDWITSTSASTALRCLTHLVLHACPLCTELPPLGRLPQLKHLEIGVTNAIKTIGPEFLGCSSAAPPAAFPKLEFLEFALMTNWEEWRLCEGEEGGDVKLLFPTLRQCSLQFCPKLRGLPENLYRATNLKKIIVSSVDDYTRGEYSRHRSILRLAYDPSQGPPDWATEFVKEEPKVAPSTPPKILFYVR